MPAAGEPAPGGRPGPGEGYVCSGGYLVETPRTATAAVGTHPTGMHSCCLLFSEKKNLEHEINVR